ncbi:hypothetical protein HK100_001191 [Physocladia obscura]|uniref:Chromate transporter n=1 Tax=Physocladia obscura TaxID=109957 RepID=A0AAD5SZQ3_9FUNG|nr:hypothetical protein HK100_001191 [Physocladia obscura]
MDSAPVVSAEPEQQTMDQQQIPFADRIKEVLLNYLPLAFITFGGPQAHIALLLDLFVAKKQWLSDEMFTELYAISNALPGPASTQLAFTVALIRGGAIAGVLAFLIWSIPGGIVMGALGYAVGRLGASDIPQSVLYIERALASVSIALISIAAKQLTFKLLTDKTSASLAAIAVVLVINFASQAWLIPVMMVFGGIVTYIESIVPGILSKYKAKKARKNDGQQIAQNTVSGDWRVADEASTEALVVSGENSSSLEPNDNAGSTAGGATVNAAATDTITPNNKSEVNATEKQETRRDLHIYFTYSMKTGAALIVLFFILLIISGVLQHYTVTSQAVPLWLEILSTFYFVGAIIFGGGPVVVPLLYNYVVSNTEWLTTTEFLMGFAIINVMPGPNFNFAAYCGALAYRSTGATSFVGALLAWIGIFLPGLLIKAGVLPIWRHYRDLPVLRVIFKGLNSVAVGLLISAVYMLWMKAIALPGNSVTSLGEYTGWTGLMVVGFLVMDTWKIAPWWVVGGSAIVGAIAWVADGRP